MSKKTEGETKDDSPCGGEPFLGSVVVSAEDIGELMDEASEGGVEPLSLSDYPQKEMDDDLERDRLLHCAFGEYIPSVRTLPLAGSKCKVLKWRDTPRP